MHTVALIEDDPTTAELFRIRLGAARMFTVVGVYLTAEEALRELANQRPDVVLMDIKLPGMSGIQCLRALQGLTPRLGSRILMLTDYEDSDLIFDALRAGADGYLLKKHASSKNLQAAVEDVLRGGAPMSPEVARRVIGYFKASPRVSTKSRATEALAQLSVREREVLQGLQEGLLYKEIAGGLSISIHGVRKHVQSIYQKLHVRSRCDPVLYSHSMSGRPHRSG